MHRLSRIRAFLLDMDGTIYLGTRVLPGTLEFLHRLRCQKKRYLFITNNSSISTEGYVEKLQSLAIPATAEDVLTSGMATAAYLKTRNLRRIYLLGTPDLEDEFRSEGFELTEEGVEAVVLGFDRTLTYRKLAIACRLIRLGVPFIATHPDPTCPTEDGFIPDCGAMSALIQTATGVAPLVIGKPETRLVEMALQRLRLRPEQVAMVGDRLMTDIRMGVEAGLTTVLVLTGATRRSDLRGAQIQPDYVLENIAVLSQYLASLASQPPPSEVQRS